MIKKQYVGFVKGHRVVVKRDSRRNFGANRFRGLPAVVRIYAENEFSAHVVALRMTGI